MIKRRKRRRRRINLLAVSIVKGEWDENFSYYHAKLNVPLRKNVKKKLISTDSSRCWFQDLAKVSKVDWGMGKLSFWGVGH